MSGSDADEAVALALIRSLAGIRSHVRSMTAEREALEADLTEATALLEAAVAAMPPGPERDRIAACSAIIASRRGGTAIGTGSGIRDELDAVFGALDAGTDGPDEETVIVDIRDVDPEKVVGFPPLSGGRMALRTRT